MTEKECVCDDLKSKENARRLIKWGLWALLGLIATVGFVVFLVWAILHPHGPRFVLQDVTIYDFNISQPNLFTSKLQVTLSSSNPNDKIGILYDHLDIYASYRNQEVTLANLLPASYQGHLDVTVWSPVLIGSAVPVDPNLSQELNEDLIAGMLLLNIKIDGCVRWKVGSWVSGCYRLLVNCPAYITFSGVVPTIKYQSSQQCAVETFCCPEWKSLTQIPIPIIGGAVIWYRPEWKIIDLICTLVFSVIVLWTTLGMLRNIVDVLMKPTPRDIDAAELEKRVCEMDEVVGVHELHILGNHSW